MVLPKSFSSSGSKFGGDATSGNGETALYAAPNYFGDFNISSPPWLQTLNDSSSTSYLLAGFAVVGLGIYLWKSKK